MPEEPAEPLPPMPEPTGASPIPAPPIDDPVLSQSEQEIVLLTAATHCHDVKLFHLPRVNVLLPPFAPIANVRLAEWRRRDCGCCRGD